MWTHFFLTAFTSMTLVYMTAERQVPAVEQLCVLQSPCLPSSCQCPGELAGGRFRHTAILSCSARLDTEGPMCSSRHCVCHLVPTQTAELVLEATPKLVSTVQSLPSQLCFNLQSKPWEFFIQWWPFYPHPFMQGFTIFSFYNKLRSYREAALRTGSNVCWLHFHVTFPVMQTTMDNTFLTGLGFLECSQYACR